MLAFVFAAIAVAVAFLRGCAVDNHGEFLETLVFVDRFDETEVAHRAVVHAGHIDGGVCDAVECEACR